MWKDGDSESSNSDSSSEAEVTETKTGRRWIDASDSDDSDDDVRAPIRSAREKKWEIFAGITKNISNLLKNNDWNRLQDGAS